MPWSRWIAGRGLGRELRFSLLFALLAVAVFVALYLANDVLIIPLNRQIARVAAAAMGLFGAHAVVSGAVVQTRGFAVEIKNNCNAIYEFGLFAAAVWAYPAPIGAKVAGTLAGGAVLNVVNLVRVVSLLALGAFARDWFDAAHLYAWQAIFFALVAVCWFGWVLRTGPRT